VVWHIRNGLENSLLDDGAAGRALGGSILLAVGAAASTAITIVPSSIN
jgi:hypothetical protein